MERRASMNVLNTRDSLTPITTTGVQEVPTQGSLPAKAQIKLADGRLAMLKYDYAPSFSAGDGSASTEIAAYELARFLKLERLIPPTYETYLHGTFWHDERPKWERFSVQEWVNGPTFSALYEEERQRLSLLALQDMAFMDCLMANQDRHDENWIVTRTGEIRLIDNGFSFPEENRFARASGYALRHLEGAPIPPRLINRLNALFDEDGGVYAHFQQWLAAPQISAMLIRARCLRYTGRYIERSWAV